MAGSESDTLLIELLLERAIGVETNELVRRAGNLALLLDSGSSSEVGMEVSQLNNLLAVAADSRSLEQVCLFVLYQMARNPGAWGRMKRDFGHQLIAELRGPVQTTAHKVVDAVNKELGTHPLDDEQLTLMRARAYERLMLLFLGYLYRAFYASRRLESFSHLREVLNA